MSRIEKRRRGIVVIVLALGAFVSVAYGEVRRPPETAPPTFPRHQTQLASKGLEALAVKKRMAQAGYSREQFSNGWEEADGCDMRSHILGRDLADVTVRSDTDCTVISGTLRQDPYTGKSIRFIRGAASSRAIQIDHIVAVSDAWQKGAQQLTSLRRQSFYNDPLNLLAVDGPTNMKKGDSDAAAWLPPNKPYRCRYVARQIAVKAKYELWVTAAEQKAMQRVLRTCPGQVLPVAASEQPKLV